MVCSDAPRHHRQSRLEDIRSQPILYISNNNSNNAMASVPSPTVTYRWRHYSFLLFVPSKSRFLSILANNSNSYTLHRYLPLLRSHIVLVYFEPLIRLPIPTFHLTTILFLLSRLVWAISSLIESRSDHGADIWGRRDHSECQSKSIRIWS